VSTWWGQRLGDAVAELIDPGRLVRGRTLARTGSVLSLHVQAGRVTGAVQGSQARPYTAAFLLAPLVDADATRIAELFAADANLLAQLVTGQLPDQFGSPQHGLFPRFADELDFECTCPDWGWPCKHAAALVHVLVDGIDAQPQILLQLRGVDLSPTLGWQSVVETEVPLGEAMVDYWDPRGELVAPPVRFRPALDDLDSGVLRAALRSAGGPESAEAALRWLREAYRRLG